MNNRILETLEFEKVKQMVRQFVVTAQGKEELAELVPVSEEQTITNVCEAGSLYLNLKISVPI